jgi:hypothetical protein
MGCVWPTSTPGSPAALPSSSRVHTLRAASPAPVTCTRKAHKPHGPGQARRGLTPRKQHVATGATLRNGGSDGHRGTNDNRNALSPSTSKRIACSAPKKNKHTAARGLPKGTWRHVRMVNLGLGSDQGGKHQCDGAPGSRATRNTWTAKSTAAPPHTHTPPRSVPALPRAVGRTQPR